MNLFSRWFRFKGGNQLPEDPGNGDDITPFELDTIRNDLKNAKDETELTIKKIQQNKPDPLEELITNISQGRSA